MIYASCMPSDGKRSPDHNRFWNFIKNRLTTEIMQRLLAQIIHYSKLFTSL